MDIKKSKFNDAEFSGKDIASLPDNPSQGGIGATALKERFDNVGKMMVALGKHNELIDALSGTEGAGNIGVTEGMSVQARLDEMEAGKLPKNDVVQMRGRSMTQVMSQKAVTDAIDAGGGGGGGAGDAEPIGCMKFFAGEALPDGYLWCDGASYPTNGVYKKLFDVVGTRYNGSGDAAGTFRVPDMRGRVGVGKNDGTFGVLGGKGGEEKHTLSVAEMPTHGHTVGTYFSGSENGNKIASSQGITIVHGSVAINNTGGGQSHNNLPPFFVTHYIIKFDRSYEQIGVTAPPVIWEIKPEDWQSHADGGYVLNIPESEHRRGEHCVLTALYDTTEAGKLKAVLFEMEKNAAGDINIYSDVTFAGKAYIDRVYMVPAGRILTVNGQGPDVDGNVELRTPAIITGVTSLGSASMPLMDGTQWFPINKTLESTIDGDYCKNSAIYVPPGYSKVFVMASCGAQENGVYTFECRLYSSKDRGGDLLALNTVSTSGGNSACTVQWAGKTQGISWIGVQAKCISGTTPRYYTAYEVSRMTCIFFN